MLPPMASMSVPFLSKCLLTQLRHIASGGCPKIYFTLPLLSRNIIYFCYSKCLRAISNGSGVSFISVNDRHLLYFVHPAPIF